MKNCKVVISPSPIKTSERIDINGNIIDPRTKQIVIPKEPDYVPPTTTTDTLQTSTPLPLPELSIQDQIEQAKANLIKLEEAKKVKIEEMEKELKKLKE